MSISESRIKQAEYAINHWVVFPEFSDSFEDVIKAGYWAHLARKLTPRDHIKVYPEDGSYYAELIVVEKGTGWAKVAVLPGYPLKLAEVEHAETAVETQEGKYIAKWSGPHTKFRVTRLNNGEKLVLRDGFASMKEATTWLDQHRATIERSAA